MTVVRVKGFQIFKDRHGRWRCYHRKSREPIDLVKAPLGSPQFFAECARIAELAKIAPDPKPGTLGMLIRLYRDSPVFRELAANTREQYQRVFNYLEPIDDTALAWFTRPRVAKIRDKAAEPVVGKDGEPGPMRWRRGEVVRAVLSAVFAWGAERGYLRDNPARGIKALKRPKSLPRANRPWSDAERYAVLDGAPTHLKVPIAIMMFTGLDPTDALSLTRAQCDGRRLKAKRAKTGRVVSMPLPETLVAILRDAPGHDAITVAANSHGRPWTKSGFDSSWLKLRGQLEAGGEIAPGLTLKGLRHTVATILREEGFDTRTIADALGQATEAMARHYSRDAELDRKMSGVVRKLDRSENRRRSKLSNRDGGNVKPGGSK